MTDELRREPVGVVGRELREELAFRSSELRLSEPSLKPLLMELLSSQLQRQKERERFHEFKHLFNDFKHFHCGMNKD